MFHKNSFLSSSNNASNVQEFVWFPMFAFQVFSCHTFSHAKANFQHQHSPDLNHEVFQAVISFLRLQADF